MMWRAIAVSARFIVRRVVETKFKISYAVASNIGQALPDPFLADEGDGGFQ